MWLEEIYLEASEHPRHESGVVAHVAVEPRPTRRRVVQRLRDHKQEKFGLESGSDPPQPSDESQQLT